jgi:serine/threonine-protein kinase
MSPEQAQGRPDVDARTDLYGMGVILYEGLTGKLPFEGDDPAEVLLAIANEEPMPLAFVRPDLEGPLSDVVGQAIAREREHRFPDALAMRDALLAAAEAAGVPVPIATLRPPPAELPALPPPPPQYPLMLRTEDITPMSSSATPRRARTTFVFAATVGVLGAVLGAGFLAEERGGGPWHDRPAAAAAAAEPAPAPIAEPLPATVSVRLEGLPAAAHVRVDGTPIRGSRITLPRDERVRVIEVSAPGRTPWRIGHVAAADAVYSVVLEAMPVPAPPEVTPAPAAVEPPAPEPRHARRTRRRVPSIPAAIAPELPPPPPVEASPPENPFEPEREADAPPLPSSDDPPPLPRLPERPAPRGVPYEDPGF